ncbi:LicD family protein [Bacillus wiedmannii]|uniref:LicD family protein n=1 Tax=Bacillus wiedmannii TaxID=1890302 RepID=UPI000BF07808|nr:LicD family protein [Bacillus wiedmannii]PEM85127.1 LicD family protein [Bacillus wiedmannii]PEO82741.1 LicD family protein [Bacillus wiedmannii]
MKTNKSHMLSDQELRSLQMVLLEMLLEIDRVCKKNGISYCLSMGTMLGAVRHGGFIPWDDDLDVAMIRPEYEKFREACKRDLDQSRFFYQDHTTDPYYRWGYARIRRKDTEFVRLGQEHMKMRTGIFLDIFPMDSTPDFAPFRGLHSFYCFVLRKFLYAETGRKSSETSVLRAWYTILNKVPHTWALRRIEKLSMKRKGTKLVRTLAFPIPKGRTFGYLRKWFEDLEDIEFEGYMFPGIKDYDSFLKFQYGDYMQLPPPENRMCCHPASKFRLPPDVNL